MQCIKHQEIQSPKNPKFKTCSAYVSLRFDISIIVYKGLGPCHTFKITEVPKKA